MSIGHRVMLTVVIVVAVMMLLALLGWWSGGWEEDPEPLAMRFGLAAAESKPELCMDNDSRERVRKIMLEALDQSLKEKVMSLFEVWLRDETSQPERARRGMENALRNYFHARNSAIKFNPPECTG